MSALTSVITRILERARIPGVDSLVGIRMRNAFERDLMIYFRRLEKEVQGLKLGAIAKADNTETATHGAEMAIMRVLRKLQPMLIFAISSNVYLGLIEGDKRAKTIFVREATQPATSSSATSGEVEKQEVVQTEATQPGQPSNQPPLNTDVLLPTLEQIDQLGLSGQEAADYAARRAAELVKGIDQTTLQLLKQAIEKGIEDQLGVQGLARFIRNYVQDMSVYRSQMIATTEMNDAFSEATMRKLKRLGVEYKEWIAAPDCCDECQDIDGEVVAVDDLFSSGDDRPPAHPNCRCAVVGSRGPDAEDDATQ